MTDFSAAFDVLMTSAVAETITYEAAAGGGAYQIKALSNRIDVDGGFGEVRIGHDVRKFEIKTSDLDVLPQAPARGDSIIVADGSTFRVQTMPTRDELSLVWVVQAYKEE